ncbi:MAG TPA: peptide ABC transporter substrate-binding protein, partial [Opitutaceae bacterium]|nr:peptide ABC transporter substrate-binding protein [Opitutaceae bacterium]
MRLADAAPLGILAAVPSRASYLIAALLCLGGCARRTTTVEQGDRDGVLHIGNKDEPDDLDPHINDAISTARILCGLFESLVQYSDNGQDVVPAAAQSWDISPDGLTYTFHLRPSARWSNGEPVTAAQFRDSFLRIIDPHLGSQIAGNVFAVAGARDFLEGRITDPSRVGLSAPDENTFVIRLQHPAPYFLKVLAWSPFYPVYLPSLDANGGRLQRGGPWEKPGVLVGNGAYMLAEWRPNAFVRIVRNPSYWDAEHVRIREVRFYPTDDEASEERAFRAGQLHMTYTLPKSKLDAYKKEGSPELHSLPIQRTNFLAFNTRKGPFTDPRVRQAFSLAVDREALVRAVLGDSGMPAHSFVRPGTAGFIPTERFKHDPGEAVRLMAQAGYPGGKGFPHVELTLNSNTGLTISVAEVLQQMWVDVLGVRLDLRPLEFKVYLQVDRDK